MWPVRTQSAGVSWRNTTLDCAASLTKYTLVWLMTAIRDEFSNTVHNVSPLFAIITCVNLNCLRRLEYIMCSLVSQIIIVFFHQICSPGKLLTGTFVNFAPVALSPRLPVFLSPFCFIIMEVDYTPATMYISKSQYTSWDWLNYFDPSNGRTWTLWEWGHYSRKYL